MGLITNESFTGFATLIRTVENSEVLSLQVRSTFNRHRATGIRVGLSDFFLRHAHGTEEVEVRTLDYAGRNTELLNEVLVTEGETIEDHGEVEGTGNKTVCTLDGCFIKSVLFELFWMDCASLQSCALCNNARFLQSARRCNSASSKQGEQTD